MAAVMIQGCGSDVGKSVLVAGLCRLFTNRGLVVRPFKSQNMSNNAAVTRDGGEIGRAQALQAQACRTAPSVDMNPVLLKPQGEESAQLIVRGRMSGTLGARAHARDKRALLEIAIDSYRRLEQEAQLIIVEGAGSPAETNLRAHDIANMGLAQELRLPVVLVGDIDRGHVIASLVGAHAVLDAADRERVRGFIINKFRGVARLFDEGLERITAHTGWPSLGIVPWLSAARDLPAEDGMQLDEPQSSVPRNSGKGRLKIIVPRLPRIANFDDFDPLAAEPDVELIFVAPGRPLPADAPLIILPGTKSTIADLEFMRAQGWDIDTLAHVRRGGHLLGICGGYQMLGRQITDPEGIEGLPRTVPGLGLLEMTTQMRADKTLRAVAGIVLPGGHSFSGYEMHIGVSSGPATQRPFLQLCGGATDGAWSDDMRVGGCYVHGLFGSTEFRSNFLRALGARSAGHDHTARVERALDGIAAELARCVDIAALEAIARG